MSSYESTMTTYDTSNNYYCNVQPPSSNNASLWNSNVNPFQRYVDRYSRNWRHNQWYNTILQNSNDGILQASTTTDCYGIQQSCLTQSIDRYGILNNKSSWGPLEQWRKRKATNIEKGAVVSLWIASTIVRYLRNISFERMEFELTDWR